MLQVQLLLRWFGTGLAVAFLVGSVESRALAGGHFSKHGHGVATSNVAFVPVTSGFPTLATAVPTSFMTVAAPAQFPFVHSPQIPMTSPIFQAASPNVSMVMMAVPQVQAMTTGPIASTGLQSGLVGQQPVLSAGQLLFQQQLLQQMESAGLLKNLRDRLAQRLLDLRAQNGGVLPSREVVVNFLLNEAFALLRDTPFGPFLTFLQPSIERLIDNVIKEQPPAVVPNIPNGTPGTVKRYIITVQEISGPGPGPVTPVSPATPGTITNDRQSPLETFAPFPNR